MNVNEHFEGFPIDFFSIQPNQFIGNSGYAPGDDANRALEDRLDDVTLDILELNESGYIAEALRQKVNFEHKDTTVINCAVGQGKTTAILQILKDHFQHDPDCYFIIAVPIVSLIKQYNKDLTIKLGFSDDQIFNYEDIDSELEISQQKYSHPNRRIHLVTVNTLLGNPGDRVALQSEAKNMYLTAFSIMLRKNNKKVIIIYDEIHEAIKNFSDLGIAHLFYFGDVIQKNLVISATFNVNSIGVINKLSTLTDNKIRILEAPRTIIRAQSKLFLHYDNYNYSANNFTIKTLIKTLVEGDKKIDILCYSKKLAKAIISPENETGQILLEKFITVRECTSRLAGNQPINEQEEDSNVNKFDDDFCNVGTNFKSGVSIEKENHSFIIILPPSNSRRTYGSESGIFTEGINSVIQAMARQRTAGEIHLVLPFPLEFDFETLPQNMTIEQKQIFEQFYSPIMFRRENNTDENVNVNNVRPRVNKYIPFSEHYNIVRNKYRILLQRLVLPFSINNEIPMPTLDDFTFEHAEKILNQVGFLGRDLSSFITYAAFTNQFYNARLESYNVNSVIDLNYIEDDIIELYETLEDKSNIINNYLYLNQQIFPGNVNYDQTTNRTIKQFILKIVANKAENIINIPIHLTSPSTRYLLSFFDNFEETNHQNQGIKNHIISFRNRVIDKIFTSRNNDYFENYEKSRIFNGQANEIRDLLNQIKTVLPPLDSQFSNFFREIPEDDYQLEKIFYKFLMTTVAKSISAQVRMGNSERESHFKIVQRF